MQAEIRQAEEVQRRRREEERRERVSIVRGLIAEWFKTELWPACKQADARRMRRQINEANLRQAARFCKDVKVPQCSSGTVATAGTRAGLEHWNGYECEKRV